jgi:hypothetical protein
LNQFLERGHILIKVKSNLHIFMEDRTRKVVVSERNVFEEGIFFLGKRVGIRDIFGKGKGLERLSK